MVVTGSTRNRLGGQKPSRGFESPSLRHDIRFWTSDGGHQVAAKNIVATRRLVSEWRDAREAEGARLEIVCTPTKVYRGFESRSLRHQKKVNKSEQKIACPLLNDSRVPCNGGVRTPSGPEGSSGSNDLRVLRVNLAISF